MRYGCKRLCLFCWEIGARIIMTDMLPEVLPPPLTSVWLSPLFRTRFSLRIPDSLCSFPNEGSHGGER